MPIDVPTLRAFKETVQRDQIPHDEFSHVYSPIPAPFDPSRGQSPVVQISLIIASRGAPYRPKTRCSSDLRSIHSTSPRSPTEYESGVARSTRIGAPSFRKRRAIPNPSAASTADAATARRPPVTGELDPSAKRTPHPRRRRRPPRPGGRPDPPRAESTPGFVADRR